MRYRHTAGLVPSISARYGRNIVVQHNLNKLNVEGTQNMLEAAEENNIASFIYTSSSTILTDDLIHDYPNYKEDLPYPKSSLIYGQSKVSHDPMTMIQTLIWDSPRPSQSRW
jgi:nucleoside-diphosphate-sugar epimerase